MKILRKGYKKVVRYVDDSGVVDKVKEGVTDTCEKVDEKVGITRAINGYRLIDELNSLSDSVKDITRSVDEVSDSVAELYMECNDSIKKVTGIYSDIETYSKDINVMILALEKLI